MSAPGAVVFEHFNIDAAGAGGPTCNERLSGCARDHTAPPSYERFGQSPWIDNIRRDWLDDGTLAGLVGDGVRGVTSNPSIFAKALATSSAYDAAVAAHADLEPEALFEMLAVADVRDACDVLRASTRAAAAEFAAGRRRYGDGFVSLEVSPRLAHDTDATVAAARRLAARGRSAQR